MDLDTLIATLQDLRKQNGNLEVRDGNGELIETTRIEKSSNFDVDWKLPKRFIMIGDKQ